MSDSAIVRYLKSQRYICKNIPSSSGISRFLSSFDEEFSFSVFSDFTSYFLQTTLLEAFGLASYLAEEKKRYWIEYQLAKIKELAGGKDRQFVFAHILCPHFPFVFDEMGKRRSYKGMNIWDNDSYIHHIKYINSRLKDVVEHILKVSPSPPIIIIQGDHGTSRYFAEQTQDNQKRIKYFCDKFERGFFNEEIGRELYDMKEIFGILNAYYLPDDGRRYLYDTISPVNSFRVILKYYFGFGFEMLPDTSYIYGKEKFVNVDSLFKNF